MRQPIDAQAPDNEEPPGTFQPLLAPCLSTLSAKCVPISQCCLPALLLLAIAHSIAKHQHGLTFCLRKPMSAVLATGRFHSRMMRKKPELKVHSC
jgi:hypothetical protein